MTKAAPGLSAISSSFTSKPPLPLETANRGLFRLSLATVLRANVQPLDNEDEDVLEGSRLDERLKVYVPEPDALVAAFEDRQADQVIVDGNEYVVEKSRSWPGSHTRAVVLR